MLIRRFTSTVDPVVWEVASVVDSLPCGSRGMGFICSRQPGHVGLHAAHVVSLRGCDSTRYAIAIWGTADPEGIASKTRPYVIGGTDARLH